MSRTNKLFSPTVMIISALVLSACATKPKETVVAEPAPVAVVAGQAPVAEPTPGPAIAAEQPAAPAPVMVPEQPAPKPVAKKARKKIRVAKTVPPKFVEPEPVAEPAPAPTVQQEAPAILPPVAAPPEVVPAAQKDAESGVFGNYWLWLIGILVVVIAFFWMKKK